MELRRSPLVELPAGGRVLSVLLKELALEGSDFSLVLQLPCVRYALDPPVYLCGGCGQAKRSVFVFVELSVSRRPWQQQNPVMPTL
mmetsp:Transcript_51139/g.111372  ORF Transcript_51139/g.111372 Transcript_51139/m.111372 type:complete len:86 (-) Transcript_51139:390-647(-)